MNISMMGLDDVVKVLKLNQIAFRAGVFDSNTLRTNEEALARLASILRP